MKKSLVIERTAHYHIQEGKEAKELLYIIHGYGQLAGDFLGEFSNLKEQKLILIAPEAISKFYNKKREPVANWMTSHEREDEIKDYINYLNSLHSKISEEYEFESVSVLAFSQGTSTALRWMSETTIAFKRAYMCSGSIPPELKKEDLEFQSNCNFYYFFGDDDRLMDLERGKALVKQLASLTNSTEGIQFKGSHIVSKECKQMIIDHIN